ncbi:MAG: vanadium-dependent haloperoxidase [Saprospiraceae bacterium]|nr:vanadium-dependent haloperoxidase [Saprospiraceae bacterium]MBP6568430.1 vanadium-dependent haloperoxidase [Saprospiraceae bacterium]
MRNYIKILFAFLTISIVLSSCKKDITDETSTTFKTVDKYDFTVVHEWNELWMEMERHAAGYRPCPTANALGYVGLASYEACVTGMPENASLANLYSGLNLPKAFNNQEYHWPTVVNAVNNYLYSRLLPEVDATLYAKIKVLADKNEIKFLEESGQEIFLRSKNHGESVAAAVWDWMKSDAATFDGYKDPFKENNWQDRLNEPGAWTPTIPGPGEGMFPYWGKGRTLAIKEDLKICKPYSVYIGQYSEEAGSALYTQAVEVMAQNTPSLSYQTEWVGEFWSDDLLGLTFSPPTRFIAIANQVYNNEKASLQEAIIANAKVGIALHDAAIGCWNSKYHYNLERPESYIKRLIDPSWEPNLDNPLTGDNGISPSFPAYPSGHATFVSAASEALASVFGYSYGMTDNCHRNRTEFSGYPRTFGSFFEMALENAWSRVPLGVHYRMDAEEGVRYGTEIGRAVNKLPWKK